MKAGSSSKPESNFMAGVGAISRPVSSGGLIHPEIGSLEPSLKQNVSF